MDFNIIEEKMKKTISVFEENLAEVRAGRANPNILNKVTVDYYGVPTPINQMAGVSVPEPRMIVIQPWDMSMLKEIEKAINLAELGINPMNDGKVIRLTFPELTEERRKNLVKDIRKTAEEAGKKAGRPGKERAEEAGKSLDIQTGQIIALSSTSSKIVDNFQCNIVCILDSDEARNSEVGKSIKLRLQNSEEVPAKIVYKANEKNNKVLLVFEINDDVSELIKYRKTSFDVIWWSDSGLKIPNSAIKYDGNIAYVIRNRSGLKEKILVKILRSNDKYSIVENYSYAELKEAGYDTSGISNKKSISIFDQIEN
mgnify:CR=1 FL=1